MAYLGWQQSWAKLRASDADRDEAANLLREHCAQGRLTVSELTDRLDQVFASRTLGELSAVMHDLPDLTGRSLARQRPGVPVHSHRRIRLVPILVAVLALWLVTRSVLLAGVDGSAYGWVVVVLVLMLACRLMWSTRPSRHRR